MNSTIKRILFGRRSTDTNEVLGRRMTQALATEEIVDLARAVLRFGEPDFILRDESMVPRLVQWARDVETIYGPEAARLRAEREGT